MVKLVKNDVFDDFWLLLLINFDDKSGDFWWFLGVKLVFYKWLLCRVGLYFCVVTYFVYFYVNFCGFLWKVVIFDDFGGWLGVVLGGFATFLCV